MKISFTMMTVRRCLTTLCARARVCCWQQLRRVRSSLFGAFSLLCPAAAHNLQHRRRRVFVARIRGFSFSVFTGGSRASCCERCVFFLFWKGVLRFGGDGGSEEGAERTEEGRLSIRFLTRPSARVLRLEAGRRWREPCCGLRCWRFCWFV